MGAILEGFGDEVVLFVAFLALSLVFLTFLSYWQRKRTPVAAQQRPGAESHAPTVSGNEHEEASTEQLGAAGSSSATDGLRHRAHVASTPGGDSNETNVTSGGGTGGHGGGTGGCGGSTGGHGGSTGGSGTMEDTSGDDDITVRLIQAGGPGHAREVCVTANSTMQYLRRTYYHDEVSEYRAVKFIYQGRVIEDDNATLSQLSIGSGGAMHVHVGRPRPPGMPPQPQEPESLDLSSYFVPLFGVILAVVWVVMLLYPYVFTFISKLFLFALSLGYVILSYVSTYGE